MASIKASSLKAAIKMTAGKQYWLVTWRDGAKERQALVPTSSAKEASEAAAIVERGEKISKAQAQKINDRFLQLTPRTFEDMRAKGYHLYVPETLSY